MNSSSVLERFSLLVPLIIISTPSLASCSAIPLPKPLLDAQTIAFFPLIPRSTNISKIFLL